MIAIPVVHLLGGRCVQPADRHSAARHVTLEEPRQVARDFVSAGFTRLHITDLDAANGRGFNGSIVRDIIGDTGVDVQLMGGLREEDHVTDALDGGARWIVVAARELLDFDEAAELAAACPGAIVLTVEGIRGRIVPPGGTAALALDAVEFAEAVAELPLGGILLTAADRGGSLDGPDLHLIEDLVDVTGVPVLAAGGIASIPQLRDLEDRGVAGAVIGSALYNGALSPAAVSAAFGW